MDWLETLARKRRAQSCNVFLLETLDQVRRNQLRTPAAIFSGKGGRSKFEELFGTQYANTLILDVERGRIYSAKLKRKTEGGIPLIKDGEPVYEPLLEEVKPDGSWSKYLDDTFQSGDATVLVVDYVFTQGQADALANLLAAWAHDDLMYAVKSTVIVFTSSASLFPDALRKMVYTISVAPSTEEERREILRENAKELHMTQKITDELISASAGLNLHQVETAALESWFVSKTFTVDAFTHEKMKVLADFGIRYVEPTRGFESVGGYDSLKDYVRKRVIFPLRNPDVAKEYGQEIPRGIMLFGPAGTGKTYFSRALSKELHLPMLEISAANFMSSLLGETESHVRQITQIVDSISPCTVFIDEYDGLMPSRADLVSGDSGTTMRMITALLSWLGSEDRTAFVITTTNELQKIDKAAKRGGRVGKIVLVLTPNLQARKEILGIHLRPVKVKTDVDFDLIAKKTFLFSGDDLHRLVDEATALAMEAKAQVVKTEHFLKALDFITVNAEERIRTIESMIEIAKKEESVDLRFIQQVQDEFMSEIEAMKQVVSMGGRKAGLVVSDK